MDKGTFKIQDMLDLAEFIGEDAASAMVRRFHNWKKGNELDCFKYGDLTPGQLEALLNRLLANAPVDERPEWLREILAGEKKIASVAIETVVAKLANCHGVCIKPKWVGRGSKVVPVSPDARKARPYFAGDTPWEEYRRAWLNFGHPKVAYDNFRDLHGSKGEKVTAIKDLLQSDPATANLLKGLHMRIVLPHIPRESPSQEVQQLILPRLQDVWGERSRTFAFEDLSSVSGFNEVLAARLVRGPLVGIFFPYALQGWSPKAMLELVSGKDFPKCLMLGEMIHWAILFGLYPGGMEMSPGKTQYRFDCPTNVCGDGYMSFGFRIAQPTRQYPAFGGQYGHSYMKLSPIFGSTGAEVNAGGGLFAFLPD